MTYSAFPVPINSLSLSKVVDFGKVQPSVMKKKDKKTMTKQFLIKAKYLM